MFLYRKEPIKLEHFYKTLFPGSARTLRRGLPLHPLPRFARHHLLFHIELHLKQLYTDGEIWLRRPLAAGQPEKTSSVTNSSPWLRTC